jgi:phosphosulfolactate phosphohydrolase-like enzyme
VVVVTTGATVVVVVVTTGATVVVVLHRGRRQKSVKDETLYNGGGRREGR